MIGETRINVLDLLKAEARGATQFGIDNEDRSPIYFRNTPTKVKGQRGLWTAIDENGEEVFFKKSRR